MKFPDVTKYEMSDLTKLQKIIKNEIKKRKCKEKMVDIYKYIDKNGIYISTKEIDIPDVICRSINMSCKLISDTSSTYYSDICENMEFLYYDPDSDNLDLQEKIVSNYYCKCNISDALDFEENGEWDRDHKSSYTCDGKAYLYLYHKKIDLDEKIFYGIFNEYYGSIILYIKIGDEYYVYNMHDEKIADSDDLILCDGGKFVLKSKNKIKRQENITYAGYVYKFSEILTKKEFIDDIDNYFIPANNLFN